MREPGHGPQVPMGGAQLRRLTKSMVAISSPVLTPTFSSTTLKEMEEVLGRIGPVVPDKCVGD